MKNQNKKSALIVISILVSVLIVPIYMAKADETITVKGYLMIHPGGDPNNPLQPVRNAKIKIYDAEIIEYPVTGWGHLPWGDDYLKTVYTNEDGYFSTTVNNNDGATIIGDEHGRDIYLKIYASNSHSKVVNNPDWLLGGVYEFTSSTKKDVPDGGEANFGSFRPSTQDTQIAFEMLSHIEYAWEFMADVVGFELEKVTVFYKDVFTPLRSFCFPESIGDVIQIGSEVTGIPEWILTLFAGLGPNAVNSLAGLHIAESTMTSSRNYETLFHEYAHFVMDQIGDLCPPWPEMDHYVDEHYTPEHALIEGWAEFFSSVVRDYHGYSNPTLQSNWDIETDVLPDGDDVEGNIATILWDIYDEYNPYESLEEIQVSFPKIVQVLTNYDPNLIFGWPLGADHPWTIYDFFEGYRINNAYSPSISQIWLLLAQRGIEILDETPPNNPTHYTSSHNGFIPNPDHYITVDMLGAYDDISGIETYAYKWDNTPDTELSIYGGNYESDDPHIQSNYLDDGTWYLHLFTWDRAGNHALKEDHYGPFIIGDFKVLQIEGTFFFNPGGIYTTSSSQITLDTYGYKGKLYDGTALEFIGIPGGTILDYTGAIPLSTLPEGPFDLKVYGKMGDENEEVETIPMEIDDTPPTINLVIGNPKYSSEPTYVNVSTDFTLEASDSGSGLKTVEYKLTGGIVDTGWITYLSEFQLVGYTDRAYTLHYRALDNLDNIEEDIIQIFIDNTNPSLDINVGTPQLEIYDIYVKDTTSFTLISGDYGSGLERIEYNIIKDVTETGWITYTSPFMLPDLGEGEYTVRGMSHDFLGNNVLQEITVVKDNLGPTFLSVYPPEDFAIQGEVTFTAEVYDQTGVTDVKISILSDTYESLGHNDIPLYYDPVDEEWTILFDSLQLSDGYYKVKFDAVDRFDNPSSITIDISIRNPNVSELLPYTQNSKAGRTMPIKFSLTVDPLIDSEEPFIVNENLVITIVETSDPSEILQVSTYGDTSRDYRIDIEGKLYITNFKTLKKPAIYMVTIEYNDIKISEFTFSTTK